MMPSEAVKKARTWDMKCCSVGGREVNLLGSPKGCFSLFVHLPDVRVLDGEEDKAMGVWEEEGFWGMLSFELSKFVG